MLRGLMGFCRRSSLRRASVLAAALSLGAAPVAAQTAPVNAEEESNAAIARGVQLRQAGNDDEALAEFRRADQLMPSPRTKAQIALAEQALGQWVAAERDLRAALSAADDPWIQRNRDALNAAMQQISSRLGSLEVRTATAGAELFINEERVGTLPLSAPVRVAVGTLTIEVRAPGHTSQRRTVEVTANARLREVFTLVVTRDLNAGNGAEPAGNTGSNSGSNSGSNNGPARGAAPASAPGVPVAPIVVMGVGGASFVLSGVFGALRGGALSACPYNRATDTLECDGPAATLRAQAGPGYTTGVNVTLVGGALLVAGGGAWLLASMLTRPASREAATAMVVPTVRADGAAINVLGRF